MEKKPDEAVAVPEVTGGPREERRRRYSAPEKLGLLAEAEAPGGSISLVSRKNGVASSLPFRWRGLRDAGSLTGLQSGEAVVAESEAQKLRAQVRELQRLLGQKTEEVEILRAAIRIAREKKLLSPPVLAKMEALL
ncbi:MAG: transposase [Myxococcaceae bacterium]